MTAPKENQTTRRRAPGMSPEQRRAMIIQTAIPLIAEYGAAVTTAKVARAAGIGEGTIFRVFADKDELLQACLAEALSPEHAIRELGAIDMPSRCPTGSRRRPRRYKRTCPNGRDRRLAARLRAPQRQAPRHRYAARAATSRRPVSARPSPICWSPTGPRCASRRNRSRPSSSRCSSPSRTWRTSRQLTTQELVELFLHGALAGGAK